MKVFATATESLDGASARLKIRNVTPGHFVSLREVFSLWRTSRDFRLFFSNMLADVKADAHFWEMPPISASRLEREFECVVIAAAGLDRVSNCEPFKAKLMASHQPGSVISLSNLGGDAELVVPRDLGGGANYAHLAAFLRTAPTDQLDALWKLIGEQVETRLAAGAAFWLSTAGMGVAWLHVRFDSSPKYYAHDPYRKISD